METDFPAECLTSSRDPDKAGSEGLGNLKMRNFKISRETVSPFGLSSQTTQVCLLSATQSSTVLTSISPAPPPHVNFTPKLAMEGTYSRVI